MTSLFLINLEGYDNQYTIWNTSATHASCSSNMNLPLLIRTLGMGKHLGGPIKEVPKCVGGWKPEVHIWASSLHILFALLIHTYWNISCSRRYMYFPTCHPISPHFVICCSSGRHWISLYFNNLRNRNKCVVIRNRFLKADCLNYKVFFQVW